MGSRGEGGGEMEGRGEGGRRRWGEGWRGGGEGEKKETGKPLNQKTKKRGRKKTGGSIPYSYISTSKALNNEVSE